MRAEFSFFICYVRPANSSFDFWSLLSLTSFSICLFVCLFVCLLFHFDFSFGAFKHLWSLVVPQVIYLELDPANPNALRLRRSTNRYRGGM